MFLIILWVILAQLYDGGHIYTRPAGHIEHLTVFNRMHLTKTKFKTKLFSHKKINKMHSCNLKVKNKKFQSVRYINLWPIRKTANVNEFSKEFNKLMKTGTNAKLVAGGMTRVWKLSYQWDQRVKALVGITPKPRSQTFFLIWQWILLAILHGDILDMWKIWSACYTSRSGWGECKFNAFPHSPWIHPWMKIL